MNNKIEDDIRNILVELKDNRIGFTIENYLKSEGRLVIIFEEERQLWSVEDKLYNYIKDILLMLNDYCLDKGLKLEAIFSPPALFVLGFDRVVSKNCIKIPKLIKDSNSGKFWKKNTEFYLKISRNSNIVKSYSLFDKL